MAISFRSTPIFCMDLPEIEDMTASFKYHYFTPGEAAYPGNKDRSLDSRDRQRYGTPRQIIIDLKKDSLENLSLDDKVAKSLSRLQITQILSADNFSKAMSETELQSLAATRLKFMAMPALEDTIANDFSTDEATDNYDSFFKLASNVSDDVKELLSAAVARDNNSAAAIVFDPTTNLPISEYNENKNSYETNTTIFNSFVGDVVGSIGSNYLSGEFLNYFPKMKPAKDLQEGIRKEQRAGAFDFSQYEMPVDEIEFNSSSTIPGIGLIGIVAFKTRIDGEERIPEKPLVLLERNKNRIIDNAIIYGAEYEYSLHTLALCVLRDESNKLVEFLVLSPGGRKISVDCIEAKPPKGVTTVNFRFLDSSMNVEWDLPSQVSETGKPVNDIKYVQVFERDTVHEPFRLYNMLDFNDSLVKIPLPESVPLSRTVYTQQSQNWIEVPLPQQNAPKIWAVCTVDAHGNSSNYSAQYRATVDSLNNYSMEHVAYPGSPKQYPNLTMVNDAFVDSIKVSGCEKMEVYHNPTVTVLQSSKEEQVVQISRTREASGTGKDSDLPAYVLQLIDLETQEDQVINFYIKEK